MNGSESFKLAEIIFDALLRLLEVATQIAIIGVLVMAAFIFVSIIYLCFKDVTTNDEYPVKNRRKYPLSSVESQAIALPREKEDSSLLAEPATPEALRAKAFFPRSFM
jgi:hypothetical protein